MRDGKFPQENKWKQNKTFLPIVKKKWEIFSRLGP